MIAGHCSNFAKVVIFALLAVASSEATQASHPRAANSLPTQTDVVWIGVAVAAIGAGIGFGIYFAVRPHGRRLTGCSGSGPDGPELVSESDQQTYALGGDVTGIKTGERIRISGKKDKGITGAHPHFLVEKLNKDFGACKTQPVMR